MSVGLIDPSVQEALGVDEDDEDGHSLEQSDARKDMSEYCGSDRTGGHPGVQFIRTI